MTLIYIDREKNFLICECGQKQYTRLARLYDLSNYMLNDNQKKCLTQQSVIKNVVEKDIALEINLQCH